MKTMFPSPFLNFEASGIKISQDDITKSQANKIANTVMFVKQRDQHNNLAFCDCFTFQNLYKFYYYIVSKIP